MAINACPLVAPIAQVLARRSLSKCCTSETRDTSSLAPQGLQRFAGHQDSRFTALQVRTEPEHVTPSTSASAAGEPPRTGRNQIQEIQSAESTCWSSSEEEPGQEGVLNTSTQVYEQKEQLPFFSFTEV